MWCPLKIGTDYIERRRATLLQALFWEQLNLFLPALLQISRTNSVLATGDWLLTTFFWNSLCGLRLVVRTHIHGIWMTHSRDK